MNKNMGIGDFHWIFNPKPENIDIEYIVHSLSYIVRFGGNVNFFYSVAQHLVHCSELVEPKYAFPAIIHDFGEGLIGDMKSYVKRRCPDFIKIEDGLMKAICKKFSIDYNDETLWKAVKKADLIMLATEFRDVSREKMPTDLPYPPIQTKLKGWSQKVAKKRLLDRFYQLQYEYPFVKRGISIV